MHSAAVASLILRPDATMSGKIREKTIANDAGSSARAATDGKSISAFSPAGTMRNGLFRPEADRF